MELVNSSRWKSTSALPVSEGSAASEEVQELRQQLRQLTDELHLLRNNLRKAPEMMLSAQNLASPGMSSEDLPEYANSGEVKPPLPPRLYRPPQKPLRTFEHDTSCYVNRNSEFPGVRLRSPPFQNVSTAHGKNSIQSFSTSSVPPQLPPKSPTVLDRMRPQGLPTMAPQPCRENDLLFKATPAEPVISETRVKATCIPQSPRGIQTNGSITPPKFGIHPVSDRRKVANGEPLNGSVDADTIGNLGCLGELLNESAVIRELETSFSKGIFWYNVGPVTLFLNPFNDVAANGTLLEVREAPKPLTSLALELQSAFRDSETSQSVVFCGEKGSGKTYLSMQLIRELFVAFGGHLVLDSEAFQSLSAAVTLSRSLCRCRTQRSSDASLVGFLYEIHIADGLPCKSKLYCCFTDLTRITNRKSKESNFHIFYEMLAGLSHEEKGKFHLNSREISDFVYLRGSCIDTVTDVTNERRRRFMEWKNSLAVLGIPFSDVVRLLAAVLLLGNVLFEDTEDLGEVEMKGQKELEAVAALLGLSGISLYKALTRRTRSVKGNQMKTHSNAAAANSARDALARTLYYRCVSAIIRRANCVKAAYSRPNNNNTSSGISSSDGESSVQDSGIGLTPTSVRSFSGLEISQSSIQNGDGMIAVLDFFGFSNLEQNLFEDFCINTVSEKLQRFYQSQIQRSQQIMLEEQVQLLGFDFEFRPKNDCLDLLLSPRSGVLFLLDEECSNANGSFSHFIQHLKQQQKSCKAIEFPDGGQLNFVLHHYGGMSIDYFAADFVRTNRDELPAELVRVFAKPSCNFGFASYLFSSDVRNLENDSGPKEKPAQRIIPSCGADILASNGQSLVSFSQDFALQVDTFLKSLGNTRVRFVHCLKPNLECEYRKFDCGAVSRQLRRLDILPTAQLLSAGFPYCVSLEEFNNRYRFLAVRYQLNFADSDSRSCEETKVILDCYLKAVDESNMPYISNQWVLGTKHIFLSQGAHDQLETLWRSSCPIRPSPAVTKWLHKNNTNVPYLYQPGEQNQATHLTSPRPKPIIDSNAGSLAGKENKEEAIGRATSLYGINISAEVPPVPSTRQYTVINDRKINFPQRRIMTGSYRDEESGINLHSGDIVTVVGNSSKPKHVVVVFGFGKTLNVPSSYTKLAVR